MLPQTALNPDPNPHPAEPSASRRELLAKYIQRGRKASTETVIARRPSGAVAPASNSQRQIWLHSKLANGVPFYNETITVYRHGTLDIAILQQCLREILKRHEIWRTSFDFVDDQLLQIIHEPPGLFPLDIADLRGLAHGQRESEAVRLATEHARRPFELSSGPLIRALLVSVADEEHRLYITVHQIIFDSVTAYKIFLPELEVLYDSLLAGQKPELPEPPVQFADYAAWQKQRGEAAIGQEHAQYWTRRLTGLTRSCSWPNDKRRPPIETHQGLIRRFRFPDDLALRLRQVSRESNCSLFMVCVAGLVALLHRYTNDNDLVIGSFGSGRTRPELEAVMGYFVNPLPLRFDISGDLTFCQLLSRVRSVILEALDHGDLPFSRILTAANQKPDPSRNPLFQIAISQQPPRNRISSSWDLVSEEISNGGSKMDLVIVIDERDGDIFGPITYNPDIFEDSTIFRMIDHWQTLLDAASSGLNQPIGRLAILTATERDQLLIAANQPDQFPGYECIHDRFERQAAENPNRPALACGDSTVTYRELNRRANKLAHSLIRLGVHPESRVAICLDRGVEMIVSILAVLKAGGAYVPLDPAYPQERLSYMLRDSAPIALLTQKDLKESFRQSSAIPIIDVTADGLCGSELEVNPDRASVGLKPSHLAYIIYTSGSTGAPKGVMVEHRNVVRLFKATECWFAFNQDDVWTLFHSFAFDFSVWEIWGALLYGGRLVIVPKHIARSPDDFYRLVCREKVTVLNQTPTAFRHFGAAQSVSTDSHTLRYVIFGGEALEVTSLKAWYADTRNANTRLVNMYGITETTVHVTYRPLGEADTDRWGGSPIGVRIPDLRIYILDSDRQPVPVGIVGEIYVGGAGVARGYLNRPELTSERFIEDPFAAEPGARMYKTGDLGKWLTDGTLEYHGRADSQIKIRGFRIELGEIEARLEEHPSIRDVAVIVREQDGDKRLLAYYTCRDSKEPTPAELRKHLSRTLPEYMLPSGFNRLETLPLTSHGKLDRNALAAARTSELLNSDKLVPPRDAIEQILVRLFAKVLKTSQVGVNDSFFDLGGHSLLAVRLMAELEKRFQKRLPLAALFQAPTIAQLAEILRNENWMPSWSSLVPIRPGGSRPPLFLFHSHGGNVLEYYPLANFLSQDQPVYTLQALGLNGAIVTDRSVEDMVTRYVDEIRSLQPEGPYFLAGFCFGGVMAFEAAQQLTDAGERVGLLAMIQSYHPAFAKFRPDLNPIRQWTYRTTKRLDLERENFSVRGPGYIVERARHLWTRLQGRSAIALEKLVSRSMDASHREEVREPSMAHILEVLGIEHGKAFYKYQPRSYDGYTVLIRTRKQLHGLLADEQFLGWKDTLRDVELVDVPGHQQNVLVEPNVIPLARELTEKLENAYGRRTDLQVAYAS